MEYYSFKSSFYGERKGKCWPIDNAKANVVIFTGMEEHASRYEEFAKYLNLNGFNVYCIDHFGQGENVDKCLSNIGIWPEDGFFKQVDIFHELILKIKQNNLKTFIFSHSMGSFMAQSFIQKYPNDVDTLCLCGSGGKDPRLALGYVVAKLLSRGKRRNKKAKLLHTLMFGSFNKKIKNPKTEYDWLSLNEENVSKYIEDPLCGFGPNNGFCFELIKGMRSLYSKKGLSNINKNTSIFLIAGKEDPVANYGKYTKELNDMYLELGLDSKYLIYDKLRHEIHNEDHPAMVWTDIVNYFLGHL